jgi:hypothetical protein
MWRYETGQIPPYPSPSTFHSQHNEPNMTDENYDRLWKMRNLFEILNKTFSAFYSSSEPVDVDEVIACSKEGSLSVKKHKRFGIKIYKSCSENGYTNDTTDYSFLGGGEEISYRYSPFILVHDILETLAQPVDTNSTQQRLFCLGP